MESLSGISYKTLAKIDEGFEPFDVDFDGRNNRRRIRIGA